MQVTLLVIEPKSSLTGDAKFSSISLIEATLREKLNLSISERVSVARYLFLQSKELCG